MKETNLIILNGDYSIEMICDKSYAIIVNDIEFVSMTAQDALAALETKSIDAAVVQPNDVSYRLAKENGFLDGRHTLNMNYELADFFMKKWAEENEKDKKSDT